MQFYWISFINIPSIILMFILACSIKKKKIGCHFSWNLLLRLNIVKYWKRDYNGINHWLKFHRIFRKVCTTSTTRGVSGCFSGRGGGVKFLLSRGGCRLLSTLCWDLKLVEFTGSGGPPPWIRPCTTPLIYPVLLADPSSILEVSRPGQAEGAPLEVPVCEHVRQAEGVIILLCN